MNGKWVKTETSTHQDHVIAHVLETTVLGHLVIDEIVYFLLDIGFLWHVYVDGEMGLLPHPVAIAELDVNEEVRSGLKGDIDLLLRDGPGAAGLSQFSPCSAECLITTVEFYSRDDRRKLIVNFQSGTLELETSLKSDEITVRETKETTKS